jgi:hypothetical protein
MAQLIDFSKLGGPVYVGRASGMQVRQRLKIDALDAQQGPIRVLIPDQTYAVNSSFFLGMFGPSLVRFDSREAFLQHYDFQAPEHVLETLKLVIDRALASRGKLALTA